MLKSGRVGGTWVAFVGFLAVAMLPSMAFSQDTGVDPDVMTRGQTVYEENCAVCHQPGGEGVHPDFPALKANARLNALGLTVNNIHVGRNNMPPLPDLTAEDIAAVITYARNSWGNNYGSASVEDVSAILADIAEVTDQASAWSGIYTEEQATRGKGIFMSVCARCHGRTGNGAGDPEMVAAPPIARSTFLTRWNGQSMATLFDLVKSTMPTDNVRSLSDEQYIDAIAQMLKLSNIPTGDKELPADPSVLAGIKLEPKPE